MLNCIDFGDCLDRKAGSFSCFVVWEQLAWRLLTSPSFEYAHGRTDVVRSAPGSHIASSTRARGPANNICIVSHFSKLFSCPASLVLDSLSANQKLERSPIGCRKRRKLKPFDGHSGTSIRPRKSAFHIHSGSGSSGPLSFCGLLEHMPKFCGSPLC